jgi:Tol biopolymer transport system component
MKRLLSVFSIIIFVLLLLIYCNTGTTAAPGGKAMGDHDSSVQATGAIAYIRNGSEIRLIDSNGRNDRQLWTHPDAKEPLGLFDLAWRPDGKELAFSSAHEALFSVYHADLYSILPDGSGFRKITNAPDHKSFDQYKKGSITVTVRNNQYTFQQAQSSQGIFIVNIIGASEPQQITLPPGSSKTLTFQSVADFGNQAQPLVAINGNFRWFMPGTDVMAGKNVKAPDLIISGNGMELLGAFRPIWKQDGSELSYRDGVCLVKTIPATPPKGGMYFKPMFEGKNPMGTCVWDWGPTKELANQVLYTENESNEVSGIYIMKEGSRHNPATKLTEFSNIQYQIAHDLKWLPDGSGFLYATTNLMRDASNIFRYDLRSKQTKQITQLQGSFARRFCVSPSGQWIVYERAKTIEDYEAVDLWMIKTNGTGEKLLVKNGLCPTWSK